MLRLFRNYLCLTTVLCLGSAVQAQQNSPKSDLKAQPTKAPAVLVQPQVVKQTPPVASSKSVQSSTANALKSGATTKPKEATVTTKTVTTKTVTTKTVVTATPPAKPAALSTPAKIPTQVSTQVSTKTATVETKPAAAKAPEKKKVVINRPSPRLGLVPPPPPDTPTVFADGMLHLFPGMTPTDFTNPANLAARRKDIALQLASAKKLLADKEQQAKTLKEKAVQFESLYAEGVISRRELENSQRESTSTVTELNDAKLQVLALQNTLTRLDQRLKPNSSLAASTKKKVKGKVKAAITAPVKVAGSTVIQKQPNPPVLGAKETTKTTPPIPHSSDNMDDQLILTAPKSAILRVDSKHQETEVKK